METKQVNIAVPLKLYNRVEEYVEEYGYRNAQDLFLDLVRKKVIFEKEDDLELRDDFIKEMLNIKKDDFLDTKESEELYDKLKKKANKVIK